MGISTNTRSYTFDFGSVEGSVLKISLANEFLSLAEVQVFGFESSSPIVNISKEDETQSTTPLTGNRTEIVSSSNKIDTKAPTLSPTDGATSNSTKVAIDTNVTNDGVYKPGYKCEGKQKNNKDLGTGFTTPQECLDAALEDSDCGLSIMWSKSYNRSWGCRCCVPGANYTKHNGWDIYRVEEGHDDSKETKEPSLSPTDWSTYKLTAASTLSPTDGAT